MLIAFRILVFDRQDPEEAEPETHAGLDGGQSHRDHEDAGVERDEGQQQISAVMPSEVDAVRQHGYGDQVGDGGDDERVVHGFYSCSDHILPGVDEESMTRK